MHLNNFLILVCIYNTKKVQFLDNYVFHNTSIILELQLVIFKQRIANKYKSYIKFYISAFK